MSRKRHDRRNGRALDDGDSHAHGHRPDKATCVMCGSSTGLIARTDFDGFLVCRDCLDQIDDDIQEDDSYLDVYDDLQFVTRRRSF